MRICLVSRELAPYWGAGIGTYAAEMARAWAGSGHEVHVLTAPHEPVRALLARRAAGDVSEAPWPGITLHTAEPADGPQPAFAFQRHAWSVYRRLLALHVAAPFDYVEFPDYWAEGSFAIAAQRTLGEFPGAVLAVRLHTPTRICRELNQEPWLDEELALLQCAEERAIQDADAVVSPTRSLLERCPGRDSQTRCVVPYPFDSAAMRTLARESAPAKDDPPTVLYFGRLERRKGVDLLIEAGSRLLDSGLPVRIRFIGGDTRTGPRAGSMREHLSALIPERHRDQFQFDEPVPREQLAHAVQECIRGGGICCFPSVWENFPNACIEAMALSATVVGSDAGGMAEIIREGESGLLFRSGDAVDLETALHRALTDADLRRRLGSGAAERIATLCHPATVVAAMARTIESARPPAPIENAPPQLRIQILNSRETPDLVSTIRAAGADWIVALDPQMSGEARLYEAIVRTVARNPNAGFITCLAAAGDTLAIPIGLERDLLAVLPHAAVGALAIRRDLVLNTPPLPALAPEAQGWGLACALASAGVQGCIIPQPLISGTPAAIPPGTLAASLAQIATRFPSLPTDPSVPLRILAAQTQQAAAAQDRAARDIKSLKATIALDQQRIAALEEHLASARYRLADRVNTAMKAAGVHGLAKAVAKTVHRVEPRP